MRLLVKLPLVLLPLLLACGDKNDDETGADAGSTGDEGGDAGGDEGTGDDGSDSGDDTDDPEPVDADGDTYTDDVDCDDSDPAIYPSAEENWDDVDQDCDGRIDGDGSFSGELSMRAVAIREGVTYGFDLVCPMTLTRTTGSLEFSATCPADTSDPDAMDLLGAQISLSQRVSSISGDTWDERTVIESSNGWDTFGDTTISWVTWDDLSYTLDLDTISLDLSASGVLTLDD